VSTPAIDNHSFGARIVRELLRETRAVGLAFAGLGIGTGVGLSAAAMLWVAGVDLVRWSQVSLACLAAGMFLGFTLVVGYGIRLKTTHDRLSSLGNDIETWCAHAEAIGVVTSVDTISFGKAARRTHADVYPAALQDDAERQTSALLERFMLPRKQ
jgi:hypothetical protein